MKIFKTTTIMASTGEQLSASEARDLAMRTGYTAENLEACYTAIRDAVLAPLEEDRYTTTVTLPHPETEYKTPTKAQLTSGDGYLVEEVDSPPSANIRISWPLT